MKPSASPPPAQPRSLLSRVLWQQLQPGRPVDLAHCKDLIERRLAPLPVTDAAGRKTSK